MSSIVMIFQSISSQFLQKSEMFDQQIQTCSYSYTVYCRQQGSWFRTKSPGVAVAIKNFRGRSSNRAQLVTKVLYFQLVLQGFGLIIAGIYRMCCCIVCYSGVLINLADKFIIFHAQCKLSEKSFRLIYKVARKVAYSSQRQSLSKNRFLN